MLDDRLSIAVGKESEVSNLHESAGQHMQEKPPDELDGIQGRLFDLASGSRVILDAGFGKDVEVRERSLPASYWIEG